MFEVGRVYNRDALLDEYGGQRYGGIITPAQHPLVFLQTGSTGKPHGYNDHWDDEAPGVFHYYGEGQVGDMTFTAGNAAVRDHAENEEELHLFDRAGTGLLRYVGEMVCSGYEEIEDDDRKRNSRRAIVFQLVHAEAADEPVGGDDADAELSALDLEALRDAADADPSEESDAQEGRRRTYRRSRALKRYVRGRAEGTCEGCEQPAPFSTPAGEPYLEPHHTLRRSDHGPGNRRTVIALCPTCHARIHYADDGGVYNEELKTKLSEIEP